MGTSSAALLQPPAALALTKAPPVTKWTTINWDTARKRCVLGHYPVWEVRCLLRPPSLRWQLGGTKLPAGPGGLPHPSWTLTTHPGPTPCVWISTGRPDLLHLSALTKAVTAPLCWATWARPAEGPMLGKTTSKCEPKAGRAIRRLERLAHWQEGRHFKNDSTWLCPELDSIKLFHDLDEE